MFFVEEAYYRLSGESDLGLNDKIKLPKYKIAQTFKETPDKCTVLHRCSNFNIVNVEHQFFGFFLFQQNIFANRQLSSNRRMETRCNSMFWFNYWIVDFWLAHGHPVWVEPHCCFGSRGKKWKWKSSDPTDSHASPVSAISNNSLPRFLPGFAAAARLLIGSRFCCFAFEIRLPSANANARMVVRLNKPNPAQGKGQILTSDTRLWTLVAALAGLHPFSGAQRSRLIPWCASPLDRSYLLGLIGAHLRGRCDRRGRRRSEVQVALLRRLVCDEGRPGFIQQQALANLDTADGVQYDQRVVCSRVQAGRVHRENIHLFRRQNKIVDRQGTAEWKHCGTSAEVRAGLLPPGSLRAAFSLSSAVQQGTVTISTSMCCTDRRDQPPLYVLTKLPLPGQPQSTLHSDPLISYSHGPCRIGSIKTETNRCWRVASPLKRKKRCSWSGTSEPYSDWTILRARSNELVWLDSFRFRSWSCRFSISRTLTLGDAQTVNTCMFPLCGLCLNSESASFEERVLRFQKVLRRMYPRSPSQ